MKIAIPAFMLIIVLVAAGGFYKFSGSENHIQKDQESARAFQSVDVFTNRAISRNMREQESAMQIPPAPQREHPDIVAAYLKANDHATDVLTEVCKQHHDQILISNTRPQDLAAFLSLTKLDDFFPAGRFLTTDSHRPNITTSKKEIAQVYLSDKDFEKIIGKLGRPPR